MGGTSRRKSRRPRKYLEKVRASGQHDAINRARRRIPKDMVLKIRTASKYKHGVYLVVGRLQPRQRRAEFRKKLGSVRSR